MPSRRRRVPICVLFLLLLLTAVVQRRLADLDFERDPEILIENNETLGGDEITNKFTLLDDVVRPVAPALAEPVGESSSPPPAGPHPLLLVDRADPRAPPARRLGSPLS